MCEWITTQVSEIPFCSFLLQHREVGRARDVPFFWWCLKGGWFGSLLEIVETNEKEKSIPSFIDQRGDFSPFDQRTKIAKGFVSFDIVQRYFDDQFKGTLTSEPRLPSFSSQRTRAVGGGVGREWRGCIRGQEGTMLLVRALMVVHGRLKGYCLLVIYRSGVIDRPYVYHSPSSQFQTRNNNLHNSLVLTLSTLVTVE